MKRMSNWLKGLLSLVALVAFGLALAWLLRAARPQGVAGPPPPTFAPPPTTAPTAAPPAETAVREATRFVLGPTEEKPGPTMSPSVTGSVPAPTPTPPSRATGTIIYRAGPMGEEYLYQLSVDGQGQPTDLPMEIPGSLHLDGPFYLAPDQRHLAVSYWAEEGDHIYILDVENGEITPLIRDRIGAGGKFFGWHPNGQEVLYQTINALDAGLWLVDIDTGQHRVIAQPEPPDGIMKGGVSPDGKTIIYTWTKGLGFPTEVWKVNADGTDPHLLFTPGVVVAAIEWSSNGTQVAYVGDGLCIMDSNGQSQGVLSTKFYWGYRFRLVWSPDGRTITFVGREPLLPGEAEPPLTSFDREALRGNIYLVDVASGQERLLMPGSTEGNIDPVWSPSGSRIAFVSNRSGSPEIWVINVDGTGLQQITNDGMIKRYPAWVQR